MRMFALAGFLALLVAGGMSAHASRGAEAQALAEARREAEQAALRSRRFEQAAAQATDEAARARAEAEALAAGIEAAEADLTAAEARIALIESFQAEQRARLAERQGPVVRLTGALQTMARRPPALALVQPGSIDDAAHVRSLLAASLPEIRRRTAALRGEAQRAEALRRQAEQAREALLASRGALLERRAALARFAAGQRERSQSLAGLALSESDRALALGEEARALARLAGTREFQARLEASLAQLPGPSPRPGSASEGAAPDGAFYLLPVAGRLVSGVGEISDGGVHSRGLTIAPEPGAPVVAPAAGRVVHAASFRSYGNVVIIDHGRGWATMITHLSALDVREGQAVRRGAAIGRAGDDRPRITVELRREGRPVPLAQMVRT